MWYRFVTPTSACDTRRHAVDPIDERHGLVIPNTDCPRCGHCPSGETLIRVPPVAESRLLELRLPQVFRWAEWDGWRDRIARAIGVDADRVGVGSEIGAPRGRLRVRSVDRVPDFVSAGLWTWVRARVRRSIVESGLRGVVLTAALVTPRGRSELNEFFELGAEVEIPVAERAPDFRPCVVCGRVIDQSPFRYFDGPPTPVLRPDPGVDIARLEGTISEIVSDRFRELAVRNQWTNVEFTPIDCQ